MPEDGLKLLQTDPFIDDRWPYHCIYIRSSKEVSSGWATRLLFILSSTLDGVYFFVKSATRFGLVIINMIKNSKKSRATQKIVILTIFRNTRKIAIFAAAWKPGHKWFFWELGWTTLLLWHTAFIQVFFVNITIIVKALWYLEKSTLSKLKVLWVLKKT